jgi:SAM-dependent methyltransferase
MTPMRDSLLAYLRCPLCREKLALATEQREGPHIMHGSLGCSACQREYTIAGGVPRLLSRELPPDVAHTARNFGQSWRLWNQIDDERYRWQFLRWMQPLQPADFAGRLVLDMGCGKGRHMRVVAQFGAREVIGVDLSDAVDVAFANTREIEHAHVVQGDIFQMPVVHDFDLGFSIGVLHHTPDPASAFAVLANQVRPGGTVACWVYGRENNGWIVHAVDPIRIGITSRLPSKVVHVLSYGLTSLLFAGTSLVYRPIEKLGIKPFYADYMRYLRDLGFGESQHIVYDHLIAPTAAYLPRAEVERWFDSAGIQTRSVSWVQQVSWAGVGQKPEA